MGDKPELSKTEAAEWSWPSLKSSQLADLFGLSDRRIRQLVKDGVIPKSSRDRYPLRECVQAYIRYLKANPSESASVADLEFRKLKAETEERQAKAERAQLELDVRRGELISREDMYREWTGRCVELRAAMLGLPNELGFRFTDEDTRALVEEVSEDFVRSTLETWSREGPRTPKPVEP